MPEIGDDPCPHGDIGFYKTCEPCLDQRLCEVYEVGVHSGAKKQRTKIIDLLASHASDLFMESNDNEAKYIRNIVREIEALDLPEHPNNKTKQQIHMDNYDDVE